MLIGAVAALSLLMAPALTGAQTTGGEKNRATSCCC
jgi:hypothetical protein